MLGFKILKSPFHLVKRSPWPLLSGIGAYGLTFGAVVWWHYGYVRIILRAVCLLIVLNLLWWKDVVKENLAGFHKSIVKTGFRFGMILFISSEVAFFFSFFWGYYHNVWNPGVEIGCSWPPHGFDKIVIDPFSVPLLNTVLLLSSGATITWCHHSIVNQNSEDAILSLGLTILLGIYFLVTQGNEYYRRLFSFNSRIYGNVFFLLTGFHGLHVTIGVICLSICLLRLVNIHYNSRYHVGFEASAWYWHFVDVVWLFLYFFLYWYGF